MEALGQSMVAEDLLVLEDGFCWKCSLCLAKGQCWDPAGAQQVLWRPTGVILRPSEFVC